MMNLLEVETDLTGRSSTPSLKGEGVLSATGVGLVPIQNGP